MTTPQRRARPTKEDMIDKYLATTPLATIVERRKVLRQKHREKERAMVQELLVELNLQEQEDENEKIPDDATEYDGSSDEDI